MIALTRSASASRLLFPLICIALVILFPGPSTSAEDPELHLASDVWPPFTDEPGRQRFAIDLVREALSRAGIAASISILPEFGAVTQGLLQGQFDGSAALWRSAERETYLLYSRRILENRLVLVGRSGSDVSASSLAELSGKKVAVVGTYAYGEEVEKAAGTEFIAGTSDQYNLELLLQREVDYILVDDLLMQHVLSGQRDEAASHLEVGTTPIIRRSLHFGVRRDLPGAGSIVERFNAEILKMLIDGTYNRILQLNWIRSDIDGDGRLELILKGTQAGTVAPGSVYAFRRPGVTGLQMEPPGEEQKEEDRYWIEGKLYHDWENVPDRYKTPEPNPDTHAKTDTGMFRFRF